jgi:ubiquinone/menaquinone biosynthesis C-methylase UbiE
VDLSPKMVEFGQALAIQNGLTNLSNTASATSRTRRSRMQSLDLAILSQALHHAEHPQRAIDAAFRISNPAAD